MTRLIAPLLFGLSGAAILIGLGTWQLQRLDWKRGVLEQIETTIAGSAKPLPRLVSPEDQKYQPVSLSGTVGEGALYVLVSAKRIGAGWRVISPFTTEDGRTVLLDRGFTPVDLKQAPARAETLTIEGNLHWPDDRNSSTPANDTEANTWFARDIGPMAEALGTEPLLVVTRSMTPPDPGLTLMPVDTAGIPNDHLQYAITWFSLAGVWLLMTGAFVWRRSKED
ncbi:SURF1 family protein [Pacificoceanicola onchidii]|uniref:SURF1 family protein n=1 Tax=Pacificoceanicola onchidii TaxID=2562685 RepID=UPI0010A2DBA2|nr:SURF1 family protein [Pacificoceanicola onchidii]